MNRKLEGKVAVVTGGSRGVGAAIVERLASEGANIVLTYASNTEAAKKVAEKARRNGVSVLAIKANSADVNDVQAAINTANDEFNRIDILVNNAGVLRLGTIDEFSLDEFDETVAVNVRGVFVATKAAVEHMQEGGRVINIGSVNAEQMPFPGGSVYAMSKAALVGLTKGLARDLAPKNITVNNLQMGPVDTDMNPENGELAPMLLPIMALDRYAKAEEIAALVSYLAGPESSYVTGASLTIDGGFTA